MQNAVSEYIKLMEDMHVVLESGVKSYVRAIKAGMQDKYDTATIDNIADKIYQKIRPDKQKGYYPHYRRILNSDYFDNLMPHMQRVADSLNESMHTKRESVDGAIKELDSYVSGRAKKELK